MIGDLIMVGPSLVPPDARGKIGRGRGTPLRRISTYSVSYRISLARIIEITLEPRVALIPVHHLISPLERWEMSTQKQFVL